jgi:hypothetical protein
VRGVPLTGLGGTVAFDSIADLQVPPGGATRQITVSVIWQLGGQASAGITKLEMAYRVSVVDLQNRRWYEEAPGPTPVQLGPLPARLGACGRGIKAGAGPQDSSYETALSSFCRSPGG